MNISVLLHALFLVALMLVGLGRANAQPVSPASAPVYSFSTGAPSCDPAQSWSSTTQGRIKLWWPTSRAPSVPTDLLARLDNALAAIESTGLRLQVDDSRLPCNGGGPEIDFYFNWERPGLPPMGGTLGACTVRYSQKRHPQDACAYDAREPVSAQPSYVLVNWQAISMLSQEVIYSDLVHEIVHVVQNTYPFAGSDQNRWGTRWWTEGGATWAQFLLTPTLMEHQPLRHQEDLVANLADPLFCDKNWTSQGVSPCRQRAWSMSGADHDYGAYLFLLAVTDQAGGQSLAATWDEWAKSSGSGSSDQSGARLLRALDNVLNSNELDLATLWHRFAVSLWGENDTFRGESDPAGAQNLFDRLSLPLTTRPQPKMDVELKAGTEITIQPADLRMLPLSSVYYHFKAKNKSARSVSVLNPFADQILMAASGPRAIPSDGRSPLELAREVHLQVLYRLEGSKDWEEPLDWSEQTQGFLCRDKSAERFAEMVLVLSASNWDHTDQAIVPTLPLRVMVSPLGCHAYMSKFEYSNEIKDTASWTLRGDDGTATWKKATKEDLRGEGSASWRAEGNSLSPGLGFILEEGRVSGTRVETLSITSDHHAVSTCLWNWETQDGTYDGGNLRLELGMFPYAGLPTSGNDWTMADDVPVLRSSGAAEYVGPAPTLTGTCPADPGDGESSVPALLSDSRAGDVKVRKDGSLVVIRSHEDSYSGPCAPALAPDPDQVNTCTVRSHMRAKISLSPVRE